MYLKMCSDRESSSNYWEQIVQSDSFMIEDRKIDGLQAGRIDVMGDINGNPDAIVFWPSEKRGENSHVYAMTRGKAYIMSDTGQTLAVYMM